MSADLGPLPDTPFGLFHESPGDDDSEGWQEFIDAPGYTADQMRAERERCYAFGVARERERWEAALRLTWRGIDPLHPAGQPGSYARGSHNGYAGALEGLRENLKIATKDQT